MLSMFLIKKYYTFFSTINDNKKSPDQLMIRTKSKYEFLQGITPKTLPNTQVMIF